MICGHCKGSGGFVYDEENEPDGITCLECGGWGRVYWWEPILLRVHCWIDMRKEDMRFTRIGNRLWRAFGKERKARRLAKGRTTFELAALHGERLNRLRCFATHLENGVNCGRSFRVESRMVAEAERACEIAKEDTYAG